MTVLVCGGRDFKDENRLMRALDWIHGGYRISRVIQGGASGADALAKKWAQGRGIPTGTYYANWKLDGRSAGPKRNALMLSDGRPDLVIAFKGGSGTADMVRRAEHAGVPVVVR